MLKLISVGYLLIITQISFAQIFDQFTDGDFTNNPTWNGDTLNYEVDASLFLHLNAPAQTDTSYLSISSSAINNTTWEFLVQMNFNPSSSNFAKIYLVSDHPNLKSSLNGYFVKVGNSSDEISLYRQDGLIETKIIDGIDDRVNTNPVNSSIKVTRDQLGNWQLFSDTTGGSNFILEGIVLDNNYNSSSYFGISSRYTTTRSTLFFYDNFNVTSSPVIDTIPPALDSLIVIDSNSLDLYFNEPINLTASQQSTNYFVNSGIGNPNTATRDLIDSSLIHISFSNTFVNGQSYILSISNIQDTAANAVTAIIQPFDYILISNPLAGDVILNEIFADPTPQNGLPSHEFVELYNPTSNILNLNNWKFINSTTSKNLPDVNLFPNSYIILCDINDTSLFLPFGNVIGLSSFTALSNGGDSLTLIDNNGAILDIVNYNLDWYQDPIKEDGGWTLERINPIHPCSDSINWIASININGGTPGIQNSVFDTTPDILNPFITEIKIDTSTEITISFNEKMDVLSITNGTYSFSSGISITSIIVGKDARQVTLKVNPSFSFSTNYELTIFGVNDCSGNPLETANQPFALAENSSPNNLIINEILFNPFLGGVDFVEIYNNSNKIINLKKWSLANLGNDSISNNAVITHETKLIMPKEFVLLTINSENVIEEYINSNGASFIEMDDFPTYGNIDGDVYLINEANVVIDHFSYYEDMHFPLLNNKEGVSLERIDYNRPTNASTNWHSAAADIGFATPGLENSQHKNTVDLNSEITISPKTFSPNNDGMDDVVNISYLFLESGFIANIIIYDTKGRLIKNLVRNELLGLEGTFSWNGINKDNKKSQIGIYVIHFETFNASGVVKSYKKTVVLAGRFN